MESREEIELAAIAQYEQWIARVFRLLAEEQSENAAELRQWAAVMAERARS